MAALGGDGRGFAVAGHRVLRLREAARWFHGRPQHDGHAGRDPAEHAAVAVAGGDDAAVLHREGIEFVIMALTTVRRKAEEDPSECLHTIGRVVRQILFVDRATLVRGDVATLKSGGDVRIVGFGNFSVSRRQASTGRNPQTGATIQIPASNQPKFKAGKALKDAVN